MPSLRTIFRRTTSDDEASISPKSSNSPKSPKAVDFCKIRRNPDHLNQCAGCDNIDILIRRNLEHRKNGTKRIPVALLHKSFAELEQCAKQCEICRVFRQSFILGEITFDDVKELASISGEVKVRWEESTSVNGAPRVVLSTELSGQPGHTGVVNCNISNDIGHLALQPNGLSPSVMEQAKGWLETCRNNHIGQCDNLRWSNENPRLLVEILTPKSVRLCENQEGDYVALSYCWGNWQTLSQAEKDEVNRGKTLLANLDERHLPFAIATLPTTVRDALQIIDAMGVRYAWIDTLCIVQDKPDGVATMHKIYSNALFTLNACATTRATAKLLDQREAWTQRTEPCRLGGQWLTTPDMSLNELRLRSPLAERAWTLQEERLSPRMLYVSSNRMHWSCARGHEMEMKPVYSQKSDSLNRPVYAPLDHDTQMPLAQEFLLACYSGTSDLHAYWADIVKSYAMRSMTNISDRFTALSGLAAKYLSASRGDEYLAGLWAKNLAEGLAWHVNKALENNVDGAAAEPMASSSSQWPSWSWAVLPLQTAIETNVRSAKSSFFQRLADEEPPTTRPVGHTDDAIQKGQRVKKLRISSRLRQLWKPSSHPIDWSSISRIVEGQEKYTFAANPEQDIHAIHPDSGRVLVYEDRKREVIAQIDFQRDVRRIQSENLALWALELGVSTMLILEECPDGTYRRLGLAWNVRQDYFASADCRTVLIR